MALHPRTRASKERDAEAAAVVQRDQVHRLAMESLNNMQLADCDQQSQSPLFNKIPGEIRNTIFDLALTQYENKEREFDKNSFWYRPGYHCELRLDTELLRTCKKVFLETRLSPEGRNGLCLTMWFDTTGDRRPPGYTNGKYNKMIQQYNSAGCRKAQVFAQMFWLERYGLNMWFGPKPDDPKLSQIFRLERLEELTVTIRHADCWGWEDNEPLRIEDKWLPGFEAPDSLKVFRLEVEVPMRKKNELDTIINNIVKDLTFKRHDGVVFSTRDSQPLVTTWEGSATLGGVNREPKKILDPPQYDDKGAPLEGEQPETILYHVVTLSWKPESGSAARS